MVMRANSKLYPYVRGYLRMDKLSTRGESFTGGGSFIGGGACCEPSAGGDLEEYVFTSGLPSGSRLSVLQRGRWLGPTPRIGAMGGLLSGLMLGLPPQLQTATSMAVALPGSHWGSGSGHGAAPTVSSLMLVFATRRSGTGPLLHHSQTHWMVGRP